MNGVTRQAGTTKDMVFGVHHVVWYLISSWTSSRRHGQYGSVTCREDTPYQGAGT